MHGATIRAALVGAGAISAEHLRFLGSDHRVDLVGVCDRSPATARYAAEAHHTVAFTELEAMLGSVSPAVVHVCTPPGTHRAVIETCLDAGAHVVCEKPLTPTRTETVDLLDEADRQGVWLIESQNLRFNDATLRVKELVANGTIGRVVRVDVVVALDVAGPGSRFADRNVASPVRGLAGGAVHDFLPHMAYLALDFLDFDELAVRVARWRNHSGNENVGYDELDAVCDTDHATCALQFSADARPECFAVRVRGTSATAEFDLYRPYVKVDRARSPRHLSTLLNYGTNGSRLVLAGARDLRDKALGRTPYHGLHRMLGLLYGALVEGTAPPVTRRDVQRTADLVAAIVACVDDAAEITPA